MKGTLSSKEVAVFMGTFPSKSNGRNGKDFLKGRRGELWGWNCRLGKKRSLRRNFYPALECREHCSRGMVTGRKQEESQEGPNVL